MTSKRAIGIYKITSPSNRVYVGQSVDIKSRWRSHKLSKGKIGNSFSKYGFENHIFEIIEECNIESLNERERYWQDFYDVLGPKGLNLILQESESKRKDFSKSTRRKLGLVNLGRKRSALTLEKMSKPHSEERKKKNSNAQKKYQSTLTEQQKEKKRELCRLATTGRVASEETRLKGSRSKLGKLNPQSKKVINTKTGEIYDSIRQAADSISKRVHYLGARLNGTFKNDTDLELYKEIK